MHNGTTVTQFILEEQRRTEGATGALTSLLHDIVIAVKVISNLVNKGGLAGILGSAGSDNVHGETRKTPDIVASEIFIASTEWAGHLCAMASGCLDDIDPIPTRHPRGEYLLAFDPLDGSSNIDANVSVGTIFSILRCPGDAGEPTADDFLQPGTRQVAAGYALYGPSTMLVLTTGNGVNGFTLDPEIGELVLTHRNMTIPADTQEVAVDASNMRHWEEPVRHYVDECLAGTEGHRHKDFNMHWTASTVAEVHRILTRGGVLLCPIDAELVATGLEGKLRLLHEANPMAMIVEQAGGGAITGRERILELQPKSLHQRIPLILGARNEVERIMRYHEEHDDG